MVWVSKGRASLLQVYNDVHMHQKRREDFLSWPKFSGYDTKDEIYDPVEGSL